jgi:hypothetical protein
MKNTIVYFASLLCALVLIQSCTKDSISTLGGSSQAAMETFTVNLSLGQSYTYNAGIGTLVVSKQASHFQVSQTGTSENGTAIYNYGPAAGYMGPDEVTLVYSPGPTTSESNTGCPSHDSPAPGSSTIAIKINVKN